MAFSEDLYLQTQTENHMGKMKGGSAVKKLNSTLEGPFLVNPINVFHAEILAIVI